MADQYTILVQTVIKQWELIMHQVTKMLNQFSDETLNEKVAPGKNSGKYLMGHLIAIHDAMPQIIGIGDAQHPELTETYVRQADGAAEDQRSVDELRVLWKETHDRVTALIKTLPAAEWMARHSTITEEEFQANPLRNRLSVLINRTNHFWYHAGQLRLLSK